MPLFDFKCRRCGEEFEALVRAGGSEPACTACGATDLEKLLSTFAASSGTMRKATLKTARSQAEKVRAGRRHEEHAYMRKHLHEDH